MARFSSSHGGGGGGASSSSDKNGEHGRGKGGNGKGASDGGTGPGGGGRGEEVISHAAWPRFKAATSRFPLCLNKEKKGFFYFAAFEIGKAVAAVAARYCRLGSYGE